jgi:hypothetical protein
MLTGSTAWNQIPNTLSEKEEKENEAFLAYFSPDSVLSRTILHESQHSCSHY